jgi:hypothetical protein
MERFKSKDRRERRARDAAYVQWMLKQFKGRAWIPARFKGTRFLGLKKDKLWGCHCSKKTPGRPKVPHGCCSLGLYESSPKRHRNRWRLELEDQ